MVKVGLFRFQQFLVPVTCWDFLEIWLTMFFGVRNFGNTSAMKVIFVRKRSKFNLHFKNSEINSENVFSFLENCTWICCLKLFLLRREYFSLVVNMLINIFKTFHVTETDFFQLKSVKELTCCFSKSPLKVDFLKICFSESVILETNQVWGLSLVWKSPKFNLAFKNATINSEHVFCCLHSDQ